MVKMLSHIAVIIHGLLHVTMCCSCWYICMVMVCLQGCALGGASLAVLAVLFTLGTIAGICRQAIKGKTKSPYTICTHTYIYRELSWG